MPKLTDSQLVILSAAAQRDDRAIYPIPKSMKLNKAALATVLKSLLKHQHVAERPASAGEAIWREKDDGKVTLILTDAGAAVLDDGLKSQPTAKSSKRAAEPAKPARHALSKAAKAIEKHAPASTPASASTSKSTSTKANTKLARLIDLLSRKTGATIPEAMALTGWQAHSVRGAMSGALKKKLGLTIAAEANAARGRVYRIVAKA